ncbi:hypothetical protein CYMTET_46498 [Cymbomonas tetramitiformis]|uniref:Uncharacterized protein n=1 Tax=Cymbomonas tetramitiformis TaxID=36881 RepID=A0AAE0BW05_9CHLO|nr:hypothetical protein CYMTET_46498 [Cymbomonas tetramitiformis]
MEEHHESTCRVVASIEGGGEAYVDQCRRLKASNDPEVLESICDTMVFHVTKPCFIAALASDREKAFEATDLNSLKSPPKPLQLMIAQAARIVSLERLIELEAELALKASRIADLEVELKAQVVELDQCIADSESTDIQVHQHKVRLDEYEVQVAKQQLQIAELKAAQLAPAAAVAASTSRKGSKKQLETDLDAANQSLALLQKANERDSNLEICDIEDLEAILDGPLNNAGYDWSLGETNSETLAKVFIFAVDTDIEPDADDPTDNIKLGTTDSPRSGTPSEYECNDPKDELSFQWSPSPLKRIVLTLLLLGPAAVGGKTPLFISCVVAQAMVNTLFLRRLLTLGGMAGLR